MVTTQDIEDVREIFERCRSLGQRNGLPFGPDGDTLGSAGELIASFVYGIDLDTSASRADHDGVVRGRTVQIKATSKGRGGGLSWRDAREDPAHLLVVHVSLGSPFEAFYNGPYEIVWEYMRGRPRADANNVRHIRINRLLELDATVARRDRLRAVNDPPVL